MSRIWKYARQRGAGTTVGYIGSGPVAILAGFALAALVSVTQRPGGGAAHELAVVALGVAVVALVLTLLFVLVAQMYSATPADRLSLRPEATRTLAALQEERAEQWQDYYLLVAYYKRVNAAFVVGLIATLVGLSCAVVAEATRWGHVVAALVLLLAAPLVVLAYYERPRRLFPSPEQQQGRPDELDGESIRSVISDYHDHQPVDCRNARARRTIRFRRRRWQLDREGGSRS